MCIQCGVMIAENVGLYIIETEKEIIEKYNIAPIAENPLLLCACDSKEVIPFDFYTLPLNSHEYFLVLSTLCRGCGGYKEIKISSELFPLQIRTPPPVSGLSVTPKTIKKQHTNEMFI